MEDMTIKRIDLGELGLSFLESQLDNGLTLAKLVKRNRDVRAFLCHTYLPSYVPQQAVCDFAGGGKVRPRAQDVVPNSPEHLSLMEQLSKLERALAAEIDDFLSESTNRICVIESQRLSAHYPAMTSMNGKYFCFGREVYHFLHSFESQDEVFVALDQSDAWLRLGFLVQINEQVELPKSGKQVELGWIESIAKQVVGVFSNAYDRESNLIGRAWARE